MILTGKLFPGSRPPVSSSRLLVKLTNLISSIAFLILGAGFTFEAMKLRTGSFKNPGPGLFPLIIGACIVTLSLILFLKAALEKSEPGEARTRSVGKGRKGPLLVVACLVAYFTFFEYLGFLLSNVFMMLVLLLGLERQRWSLVIPLVIIMPIVSYLLFYYWLNIPLPPGILKG